MAIFKRFLKFRCLYDQIIVTVFKFCASEEGNGIRASKCEEDGIRKVLTWFVVGQCHCTWRVTKDKTLVFLSRKVPAGFIRNSQCRIATGFESCSESVVTWSRPELLLSCKYILSCPAATETLWFANTLNFSCM